MRGLEVSRSCSRLDSPTFAATKHLRKFEDFAVFQMQKLYRNRPFQAAFRTDLERPLRIALNY